MSWQKGASYLGVAASFVIIAVSASMNFIFLSDLGKTFTESLIFGSASASADCLKTLLPFFVLWGWRSRKYILATIGSATWIFLVCFSLLSAVGFSSKNKDLLSNVAQLNNFQYETSLSNVRTIQSELDALPVARAENVVAAAIGQHIQKPNWASSEQCVNATIPESREFCVEYFQLKSELETAKARKELQVKLGSAQTRSAAVQRESAGDRIDSQAAILTKLSAIDERNVQLFLIVMIALLVEIGSSLGLWLSTAHNETLDDFQRRAVTRIAAVDPPNSTMVNAVSLAGPPGM